MQLAPPSLGGRGFDCPNLKRLLADPATVKLFHFARFDVAVLRHALGVTVAPVRCTKIASKLVRTFTDRHGLKDLCRDLLGVEISKQQQSSDWGAPVLGAEQMAYAASDVLYLHDLWVKLEAMLVREGRLELAEGASNSCPRAVRWICSATTIPTFLPTDRPRVHAGTILVGGTSATGGRLTRHRPGAHTRDN